MDWLLRHRQTKGAETDRPIPTETGACPLLYPYLSDVRKMWFAPDEKKRLKLKYDDLLVSEGGDVGRTSIWKNELSDCFIQNAINRVRTRKKDRTIFLYYWLFFIKHIDYIDAIVSRITIAHLTAEKLEKIYYVRPPIAEQSNIVTFFG